MAETEWHRAFTLFVPAMLIAFATPKLDSGEQVAGGRRRQSISCGCPVSCGSSRGTYTARNVVYSVAQINPSNSSLSRVFLLSGVNRTRSCRVPQTAPTLRQTPNDQAPQTASGGQQRAEHVGKSEPVAWLPRLPRLSPRPVVTWCRRAVSVAWASCRSSVRSCSLLRPPVRLLHAQLP